MRIVAAFPAFPRHLESGGYQHGALARVQIPPMQRIQPTEKLDLASAMREDPLREIRQSIDDGELEKPMLRCSVRRPSVPGDMDALPRLVQSELKVAHEGWLTKQSKTGLPNWNRRWFILIGGTLYYSKSDRRHLSTYLSTALRLTLRLRRTLRLTLRRNLRHHRTLRITLRLAFRRTTTTTRACRTVPSPAPFSPAHPRTRPPAPHAAT